MWGNLKRLGEFVAPQEGDDSSYESYYGEDEDEEDEGEYLDSEQDDEGETPSPFGFVGMITKAIDSNQHQYDESHRKATSSSYVGKGEDRHEHDESILFDNMEDVNVPADGKDSGETKIMMQQNKQRKMILSNDTEDIIGDAVNTPSGVPNVSLIPTEGQSPHRQQQQTQQQEKPKRVRPPRADSVITQGMPYSMSPRQLSSDQRPALVREKGSVSPGNHWLSRETYVERRSSDPDENNSNTEQRQQQTLKLTPSSSGNQVSSDAAMTKTTAGGLVQLPLPFNDDEEERVDRRPPTVQPVLPQTRPDETKSKIERTERTKPSRQAEKNSKITQPASDGHKTSKEASSRFPVAATTANEHTDTARNTESGGSPLTLEKHESDDQMTQYPAQHKSTGATSQPQSESSLAQDKHVIHQLEQRCKELQTKLCESEARVSQLEQQRNGDVEKSKTHDEELYLDFQQKEARLLQAAAEDHNQEMDALRQEYEHRVQSLQQQIMTKHAEEEKEHSRLKRSVEELKRRAEKADRELEQSRMQHETELLNVQRQQQRDHNASEEKLAQTMAALDDREEQIVKLKKTVKSLQSSMSEHQEGAAEAEEEMDELHSENETLRDHLETLEKECEKLRSKVEELQSDSDQLSVLKMELRMIREQHERETAKVWSEAESAASNTEQLEAQRGELAAKVQDLERQLAASVADVQVARTDMERVAMSNANLQSALEALQSEREAELGLIDERRTEAEVAAALAHAAAMDAANEVHEAQIRQIKMDSEKQLAEYMQTIAEHREKNERLRSDNVQMRRSLDEAIHRLQATQDDVVDRTLMKNILLDWLSKPGAKERQQVLQVMANLLHFTEQEKERVHIEEGSGALGKVVHSLAATLPPPKADVEHLQGENVRDKWINFLLAETDD